MKKLFISIPMKGRTEYEIATEMDSILKEVKLFHGQDIELIDTYIKDAPANASSLWYIGESIKLLGEADIVYFADEWMHFNGCIIEHECAIRYGKTIIY